MIDTTSIAKFSAALRELPRTLAIKVAEAAAPALTDVALATFNAGEDASGIGWQPKEDGTRATLRRSGSLAAGIRYVAIGTKLRVVLGVKHAKYQVGRRPVFPRQGEALPPAYVAALNEATQRTIAEVLP